MSTVPVTPAPRRHQPTGPGPAVPPAPEPARHRRDIEGLRAVAVLLVVAYHCGLPFVGGGYVGVDVFFVISGFLITGLLLREARRTGRVSIPRFYARRALRLLPASTVVVVATVAASALWLPPLRLSEIVSDALHTSIYAMNWRLAVVGTDYLSAESAPSPLQHFWSLAVEEQFYLVWPLLVLLVMRRGGRGLTTVLVLLTAGSLAVSIWQTRDNAGWAYFGAHTRAWELGTGALLAVGATRLRRLPPLPAKLLIGGGLAAIVVSALGYTAATPFPGYAALLPVLGTAAVIAGGCARPAGLLGVPVLQGIGRLSYSWYLWHWPVLLIAPFAADRPLATGENVVVALGALVLAALTYALVENPVRHLAALRDRPWRGLGAGAAVSVLAAGLCVLIGFAYTHAAGTSTYRAPVLKPTTFDVRDLPRAIADSVDLPAVPSNLTPRLDRAAKDKPRFYREGCSGDFDDAEVKKPCVYGDPASPTTVVLFGDSHAGHWFPALEAAALQRHWKLVVVTKSACTAADGIIYLEQLKREFTECGQWRRAAWRYTRSLRPAMIVVASTYPSNDLLDVTGTQDEAWAAAWQRSIRRLSAPGTKVFFIADTPWQAGSAPDCLSAHPDEPSACVRDREAAVNLPGRRKLVEDAARAGGASIIDPAPWFCTATWCPSVIGNILVYRDQHHITTAYSRLLAPLLAARLS
ncbi:acyltransferase [Actinoplanes sp. ATCC 53533]|uniref:acyltransferase family protein n=1 Tax=Actinoplanes sp. ATCC 53533 TaxID=1288362 RepID=UPI000F789CB5|nr:acyltransferase family protein [Actinoplanes sp. ATCC 53533]RSM67468.1 acyltransferase [Actinoplanes sp. ATCC 53533]